MRIEKATGAEVGILTALAIQLWPDHEEVALREEMAEILGKEDAAFFLAFDGEAAIGFAQCRLRRDYVEGTESSPVGYLEGIFVAESHRRQGVAKVLLAACEGWAGEQGCLEFASDCELDNAQSLQFHLHLGFAEVNRVICFAKRL